MLDFETLLVVVTAVTGGVWLWDRLGRRRQRRKGHKDPWYVDLPRSLFPVILVVLVIRSFIAEPFRIPSGSMIPTLLPGDFILVNKFAYGLRLPVAHAKFLEVGEPERGDVVVFRYPEDPSQDYIKRVVGLPGDEIRYEDKRLYVNGEVMAQDSLKDYRDDPTVSVREEDLDGFRHRILVHENAPGRDFEYQVPERSYFAMGDNRDRSSDSRFWGPVPEENLVGEAFLVWLSWDMDNGGLHWRRIGDIIR
ncbi:signal peptidase I [Arhodomonas sp. SL1]|uniref:signal peptidase I n=1 Tax=Arhodomonas sp. SL1 TaxID=3425691 RepID=UPI003F8817D9